MTAISRGVSRSSGSGGETGESGDIPALLWTQAGLGVCANVADVDQAALEEADDEGP